MKSVKVHDETHRALKRLKVRRRSRSIDQVIRELIRNSGYLVEVPDDAERITKYVE